MMKIITSIWISFKEDTSTHKPAADVFVSLLCAGQVGLSEIYSEAPIKT
jgi:hypothetical protein